LFDLTSDLQLFADGVAWLLALVFIVSVIQRKSTVGDTNPVVMGSVFAIAILLSMSDPMILPNGSGIYDMRYLMIGIATGIFGPIAGAIAMVVGLTHRISIGGAGVDSALIGSFVVFGLCWVYHSKISWRDWPMLAKSAVLSVMISAQLAAMLVVPQNMLWTLLYQLGPYMVATSVIGTFILNHLLTGEMSFLSRAEEMNIAANTDHLTGLLNRRGLDLLYPERVGSPSGQRGHAMIYFDVDRFKDTNDSYGHAVGDDLLCHVVNHVAARLRKHDTFVRLGGDEFGVILPDIDRDEAERIAERCRCVVSESPFELAEHPIRTSISVGAVWSQEPSGIADMLDTADHALYQAKSQGRNMVVFRSAIETGVRVGRKVGLAEAP